MKNEVYGIDQQPFQDYLKNFFSGGRSTDGVLKFNLGGANKLFRRLSLGGLRDGEGVAGAPIIGAGLVGLGLGTFGYHAGPWIDRWVKRLVSPKLKGTAVGDALAGDTDDDYEDPETEEQTRKLWMWGLGGFGTLVTAALSANANRPWYGFKYYSPMHKNNSALNKRANAWNDMTLGEGLQLLQETPGLSPVVKTQAMQLLRSFDAPPTTPINGGDVVGQAIATGQSAAAGMAIGYITANLLGLPNPTSTAILGAVANTLGPSTALTTSMVFGQ